MLGGFNCGVTACQSGGRERLLWRGYYPHHLLIHQSLRDRCREWFVLVVCLCVRFVLRFHVTSAGFRSIGAPGVLIPRRAALVDAKKVPYIAYQRVRASVGKLNLKVRRRTTVAS